MKTILLKLITLSFFLLGTSKIIAQKKYTSTKNIDLLIKKKREYNKEYGSPYKIQLYNGVEDQAKKIKQDFERIYTWISVKLKYEAPDWKVQVGDYQTRLEADIDLNKFRDKFTGAIVVKNIN